MLFKCCSLLLTISLASCMPQADWPQSWKVRHRSIPDVAYYSNQPAMYQDPQELRRRDVQYEYWRSPSVARLRGPTVRMDDGKEGRILNKDPDDSMGMMLNDQPTDFVFPGYVNTPRPVLPAPARTIITKTPAMLTSRNPYLPDPAAISKFCGKDATYCDDIDHYPSEYIDNVLHRDFDIYRDLFGKDELIPVNISTRIGVDDPEGTPMCAASERVIQPPVGKNMNNEWKFIVNNDNHVQGIRVELCQSAGKKCAMSDNFPLAYETECKQKYIFRKLLSLDPDGQIVTDNFRLPSCCVCVYRARRSKREVFGF